MTTLNFDIPKREFIRYAKERGYKMKREMEKKYTEQQMKDCFERSRLAHPMVGFKYDTFEDYLAEHSAQEYPKGINSFSDNFNQNRFYQVFELSTSCPDDYQLWVSYNIKRPIHSVTNIHQEVLTVGDHTNYGKIDGFAIQNGVLMARYLPYQGTFIDINEVHPAP